MSNAPVNVPARELAARKLILTIVLALLAAMVLPADAAEAEPAPTVTVGLEFTGHPTDARVDQKITTAPFGGGEEPVTGGPIVVAVDVEEDDVADLVEHYEEQLLADLTDAVIDEYGEETAVELADDIAAAIASAGVAGAVTDAIATLQVTVAIGSASAGGAGAQLAGGSPADVVAGAASFGDLAIDRSGRGFTLEATIANATLDLEGLHATLEAEALEEPVTVDADPADVAVLADPARSDRFRIWENVTSCGAGPCQANLPADRFSAQARGTTGGGFFALDRNEELLSARGVCGGESYRGLPGAVLFDAIANDGAKTVTFLIDRDAVQEVRNDGKAHYDICYVADVPFQTKSGATSSIDGELLAAEGIDAGDFEDDDALHEAIADLNALVFGPALLPDCRNVGGVAPCISARTGAPSGAARIVVELPAGDPWMR